MRNHPAFSRSALRTGSLVAAISCGATGLVVAAGPASAANTCTPAAAEMTCTYDSDSTFTVPAGATSIRIVAFGATGGADDFDANPGGAGGAGGRSEATFGATPGDVLQVVVGGAGSKATGTGSSLGGANGGGAGTASGGGGGGASDVRFCGGAVSCALSDRIIVAGGGGGGGSQWAAGVGGGLVGGAGLAAFGGGGGTQSAGGTGGFDNLTGGTGADGTLGAGGAGGGSDGAGGGGGLYGGGGGGEQSGGGGSGYIKSTATSGTTTAGVWNGGDGEVTVTTDFTPPDVTVNQAAGQADPTGSTSIKFAIEFSEPLEPGSFTNADVTLGGTAGATTTVVDDDPSGTSNQDFVATVTGMNGPGTVIATVAADAANDPAGNLNEASTSTDNTVTYKAPFNPGPTASISGLRRVGSTLTANAGSPSPTPTTLGYRWFADGQLLTPVTKTLKLTSAHHGKRIQVRVYAIKAGYVTATSLSPATAAISSLQAKTISMELTDYSVRRGQRVYANIELLAPREPWSIILDGKKLVSGNADAKGVANTSFVIPTNAALGIRVLRAYGAFADRTDPDNITIR